MLGISSSKLIRGIGTEKVARATKHQAVLWFFGLTLCYQLVQQGFLLGWLQGETDDTSDRRCEGAFEVDALSPQCLEIQLFRSWKQPVDVDDAADVNIEDLERHAQQKLLEHMTSMTTFAPTDDTSSVLIGKATPLVSFGTAEKIDKIYNETVEILDNHRVGDTPFAKRLTDTQAGMQARMNRLPGASERRHREYVRQHEAFEERFDKLEHDTLEAIHNHKSDYATKTKAMMEEFETRKANLPSEKRSKAAARKATLDKLFDDTLAAIKDKSHTHDYEDHLKAIQDHFEELGHVSPMHQLPVHHAHHNSSEELASHKAAFEASQQKMNHDHQEWQEGFDANAADYFTHLCAEEPRRSYPACAKFVAREALRASKSGDSASAASPLSFDSSDAGTTTEAPKATNTASNLRGAAGVDDRLSWTRLISSLKQGSDSKGLSEGLVALERSQLRSQKWHGLLPKVACVVAIPSGSNAKAQIKHVIENFRLQSYDLTRAQLVFLYRAPSPTAMSSLEADREVEELVREHADGTLITGVAARTHGEFPSTTSLRFAAWATDADVIARWNFDEWYHADRLLMQVRALAVTSRPVSLLKRWTVMGSENASSGTVLSDDIGWESSIVGEAAWMKEHWMPLLYHERQVLGGVQAHSVVQVDMPELSTYIMDAGSWQGALNHFGLANHTATASEVPKVCLQNFAASTDNSHVESAIIDKVGVELAETYHGLATKAASVAEKLRLLCDEISATTEPLQRDMMVGQAEKMAAVQLQLSQHFEHMKAIFKAKE